MPGQPPPPWTHSRLSRSAKSGRSRILHEEYPVATRRRIASGSEMTSHDPAEESGHAISAVQCTAMRTIPTAALTARTDVGWQITGGSSGIIRPPGPERDVDVRSTSIPSRVTNFVSRIPSAATLCTTEKRVWILRICHIDRNLVSMRGTRWSVPLMCRVHVDFIAETSVHAGQHSHEIRVRGIWNPRLDREEPQRIHI